MKTTGIIITMIFLIYTDSFSQIVINEIMYAPSDATNEWFELYNTGNTSVSLKNWKWKDATASLRTITGQNLILNSNSYIVICQDSNKLKTQFPLMTGRIIQTAWSALNNSGDNVIVIDSANIRNDSVSYLTSWGGNAGGFSLERMISEGASNNSSNWGTSVDPLHATPGKNNSITPKPFDLYLKSFNISPLFPSAGEALEMNFIIKNTGLNTANNFSLNIYKDINFDSIPGDNELMNSNLFTSLSYSDSVIYNYAVQNIDTGHKQFIAKVKYAQDEDTLNNIQIRRVYVSSQTGIGGSLIINEIMYDPLSDQPGVD
ncbi:MAG: lamin tail domain-containing protein [Ignavibacteria bacterium]|nr:lamin tail domain-containing protein [Ignavibacteria bacterium]